MKWICGKFYDVCLDCRHFDVVRESKVVCMCVCQKTHMNRTDERDYHFNMWIQR